VAAKEKAANGGADVTGRKESGVGGRKRKSRSPCAGRRWGKDQGEVTRPVQGVHGTRGAPGKFLFGTTSERGGGGKKSETSVWGVRTWYERQGSNQKKPRGTLLVKTAFEGKMLGETGERQSTEGGHGGSRVKV